jgi:hypothetical protein
VPDLDSAFCNHALREDFLKAAYMFGMPLQYPQKTILAHAWVLKKGAPMLGFFVTNALLRGLFGKALRSVDFGYCTRY